ncbi:CinA family protein [Bifidobacterium callitrichidarum]|uniref:Damage-inducible protein CinA n=1 Tax=Bifidobacterium callitrichidarum TaxID=2052941 RepID=A0A2U2N6T7_9BIFI|nr:CinA family protein [Bifidobacterium callitrichidarum]PWG64792.1 damage-inducible protein CinA [Bifidobacterium callitrichidarum]
MRESCDALAAAILKTCEAHGAKIACAESLTGGLLADAFVRIPGASNVLLGSAVTYDIKAKASILGVDRGLLAREGAVHPEVARQMAVTTARLYDQPEYAGNVIGLSTTGVAGPGPDGDKPAGLVYIGLYLPATLVSGASDDDDEGGSSNDSNGSVRAFELHLTGSREEVRLATVLNVLRHLADRLGIRDSQ